LARHLVSSNAIYGAAWGALPWVALDVTTVVGTTLVISALAGVAGGSVSALAPVLPTFVALAPFELIGLTSKLWQLGPAYSPLSLVSVLYAGSLLAHARSSSMASRAAIDLRFENIDLIERLRVETEHAQAEHEKAQGHHLPLARDPCSDFKTVTQLLLQPLRESWIPCYPDQAADAVDLLENPPSMTTSDQSSRAMPDDVTEVEVIKDLEQRGIQGLDTLSLEELQLLTERKRKQLHLEATEKKALLESEIK
jgi:hypothetical protein